MFSDEQRDNLQSVLTKGDHVSSKFEVLTAEKSFEYFKVTCPEPFAEIKEKGDWFADPFGIWKFEPTKDERPDGPQIGDRRIMELENPAMGEMKAVQELVQYTDDDDEHSFTYWNIENNVIKPKNYKGKVSVFRDPDNPEKCFGHYKSTWEDGNGKLEEHMVNMLVTSLDNIFGVASE
mmetsp:Transcript_125398/g.250285  ORF Transcript_125398/g.250285 Transcript_125398/m.250285 type:complete len:178 (+) Transcript_125398:73-606(+)